MTWAVVGCETEGSMWMIFVGRLVSVSDASVGSVGWREGGKCPGLSSYGGKLESSRERLAILKMRDNW